MAYSVDAITPTWQALPDLSPVSTLRDLREVPEDGVLT
jgi:hypothetical protein